MYDLIMGRIPYLSGKSGDLLDDPSSLFFQELLKDAVADSTYPNDGEFSISGHDLYPLCVRFGGQSIICHPLLFVLLTSFSQVRVWVVVGSKWDHIHLFLILIHIVIYLRHIVTFSAGTLQLTEQS